MKKMEDVKEEDIAPCARARAHTYAHAHAHA